MTNQEIKKTLEEQLQLLAQRSRDDLTGTELAAITNEMINIAKLIVFGRY